MSEDVLAQDDFEGGFFKKGKSNWLYFSVFDGTLCLKYDGPVEGKELEGPIITQHPRTKKEKSTWVERFDSLVVRIIDCERRAKEFSKASGGGKVVNYNFTIMTGKGKRATLQTSYMDAMLRKLLKVAPNIDFEKFVRIGAFKGREDKTIISIKQGDGPLFDEWPAVPFYWQHPTYENGDPNYDKPAVAPDGTVLPNAVHDEDEGTWDFSAQNKFLVKHFKEHTLPRIKEMAAKYGTDRFRPEEYETPTHSGPAQPEIPVVTERPSLLTAMGLEDAMQPSQASELRALCKRLGKDPDEVIKAALKSDVSFDELSLEGAAYLKYRIEKKIAKDPDKYPDPNASKVKEYVTSKKKKDDIDEEWEKATVPKSQASSSADEDDDDDDDWGTKKKSEKVKSAFHDDDDDDEDDDDAF